MTTATTDIGTVEQPVTAGKDAQTTYLKLWRTCYLLMCKAVDRFDAAFSQTFGAQRFSKDKTSDRWTAKQYSDKLSEHVPAVYDMLTSMPPQLCKYFIDQIAAWRKLDKDVEDDRLTERMKTKLLASFQTIESGGLIPDSFHLDKPMAIQHDCEEDHGQTLGNNIQATCRAEKIDKKIERIVKTF